jgi:isopenicillin-N epimerase
VSVHLPTLDEETGQLIARGEWSGLWSLREGLAFLNHGSFGRTFTHVRQAQSEIVSWIDADPSDFYRYRYDELMRGALDRVAAVLEIPDGYAVAFRHNASTSVIDAVGSFAGPGDVVLVTSLGYGGIELGLRFLGNRVGFGVENVEFGSVEDIARSAELILRDAARLYPAVLVLDQITSSTAALLPLDDIVQKVREATPETRIVVDAAHAAGMLETPFVPGVDAWIANLHKWACAARGAAVIVGPAGSPLGPLQRSWTGPDPFPDSFLWTGTDDMSGYLTAPLALETIEAMRRNGLDNHVRGMLEDASATLAARWGVAPDALPVGTSAPWMRLLELPGVPELDHDLSDRVAIAVRETLFADVAITSFGGKTYCRLSAHGYNKHSDFEMIETLPEVVAEALREGGQAVLR